MISYQEIFTILRRGNGFYPIELDEHRKAAVLLQSGIVVWDKDVIGYFIHPKQVKPIVAQTPNSVPFSTLGRVHVDWSGRGHSSGSYKVLADKGKFLEIAFELDTQRTMTVAKTRVKAA
jgi:hypothetical protein